MYDARGNITGVVDGNRNRTEYALDAWGRVTEIQKADGSTEQYAYDHAGNILRSVDGEGNETTYAYDCAGNLTAVTDALGYTERYAYDTLNQLVKAEYPTYGEELFYDRAGKRTRRRSTGVEEVYAYDAGNHLTKLTRNGEDISFQYDRAGNLLNDDWAAYSYDAFNRMTKTEMFDGNIQINHYDAEGLRAEMEENGRLVQFIFRGTEVVEEETQEENIRYIRTHELLASDAESARTYYHYASDEMGSITHVTDEEGNILNRYEYDAWGNLTLEDEQVSNRFKYTGEQFDPVTQQYYLRARFYNPALARFMQEDTYCGDGLNLYAYCANNPVRYVDPSGHWCEKKADIYKDLVGKNGLDINNIDPDTRQRLMAEAANEARRRRKAASSEGKHTPGLPGPVMTGQNRLPGPVADMPDSGRRSEGDSGVGKGGVYIPKDAGRNPIPLAKQRINNQDIPLPDPEAVGPHTVLGGKVSSKSGEVYRQSATFPEGAWPTANGKNVPWSEVHWTDHSTPQYHTNPHQHIFEYDFDNHYWKRGDPTEFFE